MQQCHVKSQFPSRALIRHAGRRQLSQLGGIIRVVLRVAQVIIVPLADILDTSAEVPYFERQAHIQQCAHYIDTFITETDKNARLDY